MSNAAGYFYINKNLNPVYNSLLLLAELKVSFLINADFHFSFLLTE